MSISKFESRAALGWTVLTGIVTAGISLGFSQGVTTTRFRDLDRESSQNRADIRETRSLDAERMNRIGSQMDRLEDGVEKLIRVTTRVAMKVGVPDE